MECPKILKLLTYDSLDHLDVSHCIDLSDWMPLENPICLCHGSLFLLMIYTNVRTL